MGAEAPAWAPVRAPKRDPAYIVRKRGVIYRRVCKAACSTLTAALHAQGSAHREWGVVAVLAVDHMAHEVLDRGHTLVAFWRDPLKRLESAYRFMSAPHRDAYVAAHNIPPVSLAFGDWVLALCACPDHLRDRHVASQWRHYVDPATGRWLAGEVLRWDFAAWCDRFGVPREGLGHVNPTDPGSVATEWTQEALQAVAADPDYGVDARVWWNRREGLAVGLPVVR